MKLKGKRNRCCNCVFAGKMFKISGKSHLHCEHPSYTEEKFLSGEFSPWDTLKEFWNTCEKHELK